MPKVSVLMPAYNSEKYIAETIESILNQTYKDFEFLIINDASTDSTVEIVNGYAQKDNRIKLINNKYEKGIVGGLNTGLDLAKGEYIARIDSDDVAYPSRLETQIAYMDAHPNIGVCGSWYEMFGTYEGPRQLPVESDLIKITMLFYGAIAHPTVILRKSVINKGDFRYSQDFIWAEDMDLWLRMAKVTDFTNIPQILMKYRTHASSVGVVHNEKQLQRVKEMHIRELKNLGIEPTEEEIGLHEKIGYWEFSPDIEFFWATKNWFNKLRLANKQSRVYKLSELTYFLTNKLFDIYKISKPLTWKRNLTILKFFLLDKNLMLGLKVKLVLKFFYVKFKY